MQAEDRRLAPPLAAGEDEPAFGGGPPFGGTSVPPLEGRGAVLGPLAAFNGALVRRGPGAPLGLTEYVRRFNAEVLGLPIGADLESLMTIRLMRGRSVPARYLEPFGLLAAASGPAEATKLAIGLGLAPGREYELRGGVVLFTAKAFFRCLAASPHTGAYRAFTEALPQCSMAFAEYRSELARREARRAELARSGLDYLAGGAVCPPPPGRLEVSQKCGPPAGVRLEHGILTWRRDW